MGMMGLTQIPYELEGVPNFFLAKGTAGYQESFGIA
jgi:hypothetical protein